ncbi:MAG: 4Fe-4S binding protein, partial [Planctomycetota bacterium]
MRFRVSQVRVVFQVFVHVVLVAHVALYYLADVRTVGGLDFQDFFHRFVGHGAVTYAVIFAGAIYLSAMVFGRLFCSWGCHFGATQDLAAWCLRKLGWRSPLIRTRGLHWLPFAVLAYVFLWPATLRWIGIDESPAPTEGLAGAPPLEALPGVFLSAVTFLVCGALVLLLAGTRGFCRFVCPYGAVFRVTDLTARFRVRRVSSCSLDCAGSEAPPCTAACPTAIDVHSEADQFGEVRGVDCVRCNLCIEACPSSALAHTSKSGIGAERTVAEPEPTIAPSYTLSAGEEIGVA